MRKNGSLLKLTIVIAFVALTAIAAADPYVCGDADDSGGIDIDDVVFLIAYIFSGGPAPDPGCCVDCPSMVTDYDGNTYSVVKIGSQCWMAENLKVTHYRNGDPIPHVTDDGEWGSLSTGAYCEYDNDPANVETYGRIYNWYAVDDSRGIAPEGWHVATDDEWKQLEIYLGMSLVEADATGWRGTDEGGKLKEAGTVHWNSPNTGATNESGFTALPGGYRNIYGHFFWIGEDAYFWCSLEFSSGSAWHRGLDYSHSEVLRGYDPKEGGFSVRCVRD
jgi:uncharacterized protein (TIGR02145 family)